VKDIARVLGRLYDGIAFRGHGDDVLEALVEHSGVPVWNALTERYHPTQALADMLTIRDEFGQLDGLAVTYVGDGRNNVVRSLGIAAAKTGFELRVLAPPELQLPPEEVRELGGRIVVTDDPRAALEGSAAVYNDVWVSMGEEDELERRIALLRDFKVTEELMALTRDDAIYLHCLPAYHDLETEFARAHPDVREVDDAVFEGPRSRVFDQAENRMHTAKALMVLSLGG
jgi:ornithine carbamoyltransferase